MRCETSWVTLEDVIPCCNSRHGYAPVGDMMNSTPSGPPAGAGVRRDQGVNPADVWA